MQKVLDYYMHPTSPWTFLGHGPLRRMCSAHGVTVRIKPIDLGNKVFPVSGGLPLPKRAPQRQKYRLVELERWSRLREEPLNIHPRFFPVNGDDACRLIIAADQSGGEDAAMTLAGRILRAVWHDDQNIADTETLRQLVRDAGLSPDDLYHRLPATHQIYESYTQEAIDHGVFGVPWYVYGGVPYWGQDRLDFLERALA